MVDSKTGGIRSRNGNGNGNWDGLGGNKTHSNVVRRRASVPVYGSALRGCSGACPWGSANDLSAIAAVAVENNYSIQEMNTGGWVSLPREGNKRLQGVGMLGTMYACLVLCMHAWYSVWRGQKSVVLSINVPKAQAPAAMYDWP